MPLHLVHRTGVHRVPHDAAVEALLALSAGIRGIGVHEIHGAVLVVEFSLDVHWWTWLTLGFWHRRIRQRAEAVLREHLPGDVTFNIYFAGKE